MSFIAVTGITGNVPTAMIVGQEHELTATVEPSNATHQEIDWMVEPSGAATLRTTGSGMNKHTFMTPTASGTMTLKAVVRNGKQA